MTLNVRNMPDDIRLMSLSTLRSLIEPLGYTVKSYTFDAGQRIYVVGNGLPWLFSGVALDEDDWSPAGHAFTKMLDLDLIPEAVMATVTGSAY